MSELPKFFRFQQRRQNIFGPLFLSLPRGCLSLFLSLSPTWPCRAWRRRRRRRGATTCAGAGVALGASGARHGRGLPSSLPLPAGSGPPSLPFFFPDPPSLGSGRWRPRPAELAPAARLSSRPRRRSSRSSSCVVLWQRFASSNCRRRLFAFPFGWYAKSVGCLGLPLDNIFDDANHC